ncbi:MAG: squalene synthase HpnC [Candidatus Bipolaricaulia bacterium]
MRGKRHLNPPSPYPSPLKGEGDGIDIAEAYRYCERLARSHYENFPIASLLIPREKRKHIYAIYAFCRHVDDLGDEAELDRLALLDGWEEELDRCYSDTLGEGAGTSRPEQIIMVALADTIARFEIPKEPFKKLIEANRIDQQRNRYRTYEELLHYCDHSANPVGRLFLYLFSVGDPERQRLADYTCTALQLTNFWQDIAIDLEKGRIYIPQEDLERFGYSEEELEQWVVNENFKRLMEFELERTRELFREGLKLVGLLDGRLRVDVELFSRGGLAILEKIEGIGYDVFRKRPTLSKREKVGLFLRALLRHHGR